MYLNPFFGALLGIGLLGERFGVHRAVGMSLILAGVPVAQRKN